MTSILFVCLGNICRSPLAEGIFLDLLRREGLSEGYHVDSAGTGSWHVGEPADSRAREVALRNGIELQSRARQILVEDLERFDLVVAMDRSNLRAVTTMRTRHGGRADVRLMREFDPTADPEAEVPDPYFGGPGGFDEVFQLLERACRGMLSRLEEGSA